MSKNTFHTAIGILIFIMPFLGFPASWKTSFYVLVGLIMIVIGLNSHLKGRQYRVPVDFVENRKPEDLKSHEEEK
jgi:hypothetical protein